MMLSQCLATTLHCVWDDEKGRQPVNIHHIHIMCTHTRNRATWIIDGPHNLEYNAVMCVLAIELSAVGSRNFCAHAIYT